MVDLIAEFVEIDLHNQKVIKDRSKYVPIYTIHEDGRKSLIARFVKQSDLEDPKQYEEYFRNFPKELIGG